MNDDDLDELAPQFLGEQLKAWCWYTRITGIEVARRIGTAKSTVWGWRGNQCRVEARWLEPLASALGITVDELLHEEPTEGVRLHLQRLQAHQDLEDYWREVAAA